MGLTLKVWDLSLTLKTHAKGLGMVVCACNLRWGNSDPWGSLAGQPAQQVLANWEALSQKPRQLSPEESHRRLTAGLHMHIYVCAPTATHRHPNIIKYNKSEGRGNGSVPGRSRHLLFLLQFCCCKGFKNNNNNVNVASLKDAETEKQLRLTCVRHVLPSSGSSSLLGG